jgi:hypothetical protein
MNARNEPAADELPEEEPANELELVGAEPEA